MKFNITKTTNTAEHNAKVLILRFQRSRSEASGNKAIAYIKENWASIGEDFRKAAYWVFGRETFVKIALAQPVSYNLEKVERLILIDQEEAGFYDV